MNLFLSQDYRAILRQLVSERRLVDPRCNFQSLATAARIQKSYMSKVITGHAQLTPDQLFLICRHLDVDAAGSAYLALLLEADRTGVEDRRLELQRQIHALRAPHLETHAHLQSEAVSVSTGALADYYLDPLNQIVHICLFIEAYSRDSLALARDLQQPPHRIAAALATLERLRLIERDGARFRVLTGSLHLTQSSPVYRPWRNQLKLLAMNRLDQVRDADGYSFATVFSGNRATAAALHIKFLKFLQEADVAISEAPEQNVFHMSFDLFPWTERPELPAKASPPQPGRELK